MIHIYYGNGKGKTTAAVGLAVRCAGSGGRVLMTQFLKDSSSSEISVLECIDGIHVLKGPDDVKFTFQMTKGELEECRAENDEKLTRIAEAEKRGDYDMIVLDECIGTLGLELVDEHLLKEFLTHVSGETEVILTGRGPSYWLMQMADYASNVEKVKHPFDKGISARKGIEY